MSADIDNDLYAPDILKKLGDDFAAKIDTDRRGAWKGLLRGIVTNLDKLVLARVTQPLRDVVSMVAEIDRHILGGETQGNSSEPLDAIAERWTTKDDEDGGDGKTSYTN